MAASSARLIARRAAAPGRAGRAAWILGFIAILVFYVWTASSSGPPFAIHSEGSDYYNLLADGFRSGHLYTSTEPSPQLLALPNPYDPFANQHLKLLDLSLYDGHYYLYWGPAPALLIFLPLSLILPGDVSPTLVTALLAFAGFLAAFGILRELVVRFAPSAPRWALPLAALALATGTAVPFTLRRVDIYEVSILAGFAGALVGLYLLLRALGRERGQRGWLLLGASLAFSFGIASRVTVVIPAVLAAILAYHLWRTAGDRRARWREPAIILVPLVLTGVALLLYNWLRFHDPLEFGQGYQLTGFNPRTQTLAAVSNFPPGLWYYVLARAHLTLAFPFFHLPPPPADYPFTLPPQWFYLESIGGLVNLPILGFILAVPYLLRRPGNGPLLRAVGILLAMGVALLALVIYLIAGATMRYVVDFAVYFLLAALLLWIVLLTRARQGWRRRIVAVVGVLALAWGVAFGTAISFTGYTDGLRARSPSTYDTLRNATAIVPEIAAFFTGRAHLVDVDVPGGVQADDDPGPGFGRLSFAVGDDPVVLYVASDRSREAELTLTAASQPGSSVAVAQRRNGVQTLRPADGRPTTVPLQLERGINPIVLQAVSGARNPIALADVGLAP